MILATGNRKGDRPGFHGFTLIELVLVMAMLLIVLSVAYPSLKNFFRGRNLDSEARRFLSLTRYAQSRAVSEGMPMVLWIDAIEGSYGLQANTSYLAVDDRAVSYDLDKGLEIEASPPPTQTRSVRRTDSRAVAGNLPAIRFSPDGFISETSPSEITLRQGLDESIWIAQSANRIQYEIHDSATSHVRR